jgi:hypothetical protein
MGYIQRPGSEITDFWPDDTETQMYWESNYSVSLARLLEKAKEKWPNATLDNIQITSEKIQTECLYYNRYDSGDYTDFIILTYTGN